MKLLGRLGLAITSPRWALVHAADRRAAGRSGTDLIVVILVVLLATQLRGLFGAGWIAKDVDGGLGVRAGLQILTRALTVDLAFLVLGAIVLWLGAGSRRNLGRTFDLACVAVLPLFVVDVAATAIVRAFDLHLPMPVGWIGAGLAWGWAGVLLALAWRPARSTTAPPPAPPPEILVRARRAGVALVVLAIAGIAVQVLWMARHFDTMRPVTTGEAAPAFALRSIGPGGALGATYTLAPGKPVVVEFWATWCKPCKKSLPKLDRWAREHEVHVITINLDDPVAARRLFDQLGYRLTLLADDGHVSERYGVGTIPHTVMIDRDGIVQAVVRGNSADVEAELARLLAREMQIRK